MAEQVPQGPGTLIGQSRTAEIYAWGDDRVLKLYRTGWHASWAEREACISQAVSATGLPIPAVGRVIEVDGRHGILFERVAGPSMLQQFGARPGRWRAPCARSPACISRCTGGQSARSHRSASS